jgi:hypothetical protein
MAIPAVYYGKGITDEAVTPFILPLFQRASSKAFGTHQD